MWQYPVLDCSFPLYKRRFSSPSPGRHVLQLWMICCFAGMQTHSDARSKFSRRAENPDYDETQFIKVGNSKSQLLDHVCYLWTHAILSIPVEALHPRSATELLKNERESREKGQMKWYALWQSDQHTVTNTCLFMKNDSEGEMFEKTGGGGRNQGSHCLQVMFNVNGSVLYVPQITCTPAALLCAGAEFALQQGRI